eukprot:COSAG03_NODE_2842_length_2412_cov_2530.501513_1_plen_65_part_10
MVCLSQMADAGDSLLSWRSLDCIECAQVSVLTRLTLTPLSAPQAKLARGAGSPSENPSEPSPKTV